MMAALVAGSPRTQQAQLLSADRAVPGDHQGGGTLVSGTEELRFLKIMRSLNGVVLAVYSESRT